MVVYMAAEIFLLFTQRGWFLRGWVLETRQCFCIDPMKRQDYIKMSCASREKTKMWVLLSEAHHDTEAVELVLKDAISAI